MGIDVLLKEIEPEKGLIPPIIYSDMEIYEREIQTIFRKSWLFLGFESMVKNKGDYFRTYMGEIPVVVVRDQYDNVRVFLDICPHRGMQLVRGYIGNSLFFKCPYHGWTFSADGKLVGVPFYETGYEGIIDKGEWGLREVKNVKLYKGTIWATLDEKPKKSFEEFLGDVKPYLDGILDMFEGEIEVYGGIVRWLCPANWKMPVENVAGDGYHVPTTHASVIALGAFTRRYDEISINFSGGHSVRAYSEGVERNVVAGRAMSFFRERLEKWVDVLSQKYGSFARDYFPWYVAIFPSFIIFSTWSYIAFRMHHPRGPTQSLVELGPMVFKDLPEETKRAIRRKVIDLLGPAGIVNQDDAILWEKVNSNAVRLRRHNIMDFNLNFMRGLGMEAPAEELVGKWSRGIAARHFSETNLRHFYTTWKKYLLEDVP